MAGFGIGAAPPKKPVVPGDIVEAAPASAWRDIPADDLMVIDLAGGGQVIVQLAPIFAQWQGAQLDPATIRPQFGVDRPFRDYVGRATNPTELTLADDALNGFRFKLNLDRSFGQEVIVDKVTVFYQF